MLLSPKDVRKAHEKKASMVRGYLDLDTGIR